MGRTAFALNYKTNHQTELTLQTAKVCIQEECALQAFKAISNHSSVLPEGISKTSYAD